MLDVINFLTSNQIKYYLLARLSYKGIINEESRTNNLLKIQSTFLTLENLIRLLNTKGRTLPL